MITGSATRKNYFSKDSLVSTGSASYYDYKNSGFDRGHLLPAADMKWSQKAMDETFFMSNISPQNPYFNRYGLWRKSESLVRNWVKEKKELIVVVGGVLSNSLTKLSSSDISVPKYFYKIILDKSDFSSVAFLLENTKNTGTLSDFVVCIDSIEQISGLDFFPNLTDSLKNKIEVKCNLEGWF